MNPEIAQYEALGKELLRRCMAEEEPEDLRRWITETLARLGGGEPNAVLTWEESFDLFDRMQAEYAHLAATPEAMRRVLDWPWQTWRNLIDPFEAGMLATLTAPDGQGKTIYAETLSEYWAQRKNRVVFVHYELNRKLVLLRRTARHTNITVRDLKSGRLTAAQQETVAAVRPRLLAWDGLITYVHTPGWTMERTVAELNRLHSDGLCDVVVIDYLEKASASRRQIQMFGNNLFQREADNVEQLKNYAESTGIPVLMVAQMSKEGKKSAADTMDRTDMRGAGEKSEKANLVILLKRERTPDGYSNTVNVVIDKNTMGSTGAFIQNMRPEYFQVGDPALGDGAPQRRGGR